MNNLIMTIMELIGTIAFSISGAAIYYVARELAANEVVSTVCAMVLVFAIRMLATKYRWELPRIKFD